MSMLRACGLVLWGALLTLTAGCGAGGGSKYEREEFLGELQPQEKRHWDLGAVDRDTPITLLATSNNIPIDVYIIQANSAEQADDVLRKAQVTKTFEGIPASKTADLRKGKHPDIKLETTMKGGNGYFVVVVNPTQDKIAKVNLKASGK